jgi:protein tyrosine phosphatase (PTP) superfamily phosphohydrolase (DUF442 family)
MPPALCLILLLAWPVCSSLLARQDKSDAAAPAAPLLSGNSTADSGPLELPGLHNVYRLTEQLLSGGSPDGEEGFRSLHELGIKTVLSVDGARPNIDLAHKYGLRYVHLPIGYGGVSPAQARRLAKAVTDLSKPIYIHCHHGKHRGPAAAAIAHLCLDERCSIDMVIAEMRRAGTDPHYSGLYAAPKTFRRPSPEELAQIPAEFPEVAKVAALAELMVDIDERWENLSQVRGAGWKVPPDKPDIDPPHEALQLVEHYREAGRLRQVQERPEEFRQRLAEAQRGAKELETVLRTTKGSAVSEAAAERAFRQANAACSQCHARYRDVPRAP